LSTLSPGSYSIKLKGWVSNSSLSATYSGIKVTVCSMAPNSQNIDISSSTGTDYFTKPYTYTVGEPTLKITLK